MNQSFRSLTCRPLTCMVALAALAALSTGATAHARHKQTPHAKKSEQAAGHHRNAALRKRAHGAHIAAERHKSRDAASENSAPLTGDLAAVKNAFDLARKAKSGEVTAI